MSGILFPATWSPYAAGAGIGVLVCLSFLLCNRPLGASSAYVKARGLLEKAVDPHLEEKKEYDREIPPRVDGVLMLLPGIIIGAFIAAVLSGQFHLSSQLNHPPHGLFDRAEVSPRFPGLLGGQVEDDGKGR